VSRFHEDTKSTNNTKAIFTTSVHGLCDLRDLRDFVINVTRAVIAQAMEYKHLTIRRVGAVEYVTLNRPDVRNALNDDTIAELTAWAAAVSGAARRGEVRVAVVAGAGSVFSAGADAAWMARMVDASEAENLRDAQTVAAMFGALDDLPIPLIGRVHGGAFGGGAGLAAVCDVVVADEGAIFGFTEVKLGLVAATISPFVLAKIGRGAARELFVTGARFTAARAREIGLVHAVVPAADLDATVARYIADILAAAPEAVAASKALIRDVWGHQPSQAVAITAAAIAARRVSSEGQEGLRSFLEKRRPRWSGAPDGHES
jgi:methylglutaconyl-CoA hydratase